jgi:hypothetical protein
LKLNEILENEKLKKHLNINDRLTYEVQIEKCKKCLESEDRLCEEKFLPIIVFDDIFNHYELTYVLCPKSRGWNLSYIKLESFNNIIQNSQREYVLQKFLHGKGGYIYGDAGRGKTYIMGYAANELNKQGKSIWFDLANNISQSYWNFETRDETLQRAMNVDILLIDDFGGELFTEKLIYECWTPIIKGRVDNKKPIYISSNYSPDEISAKITKATDTITAKVLLDRIISQGTIHELKDKNYRLERK